MLMAKRENGDVVLATRELENTKDFICRFCGREVILKKGTIKSPHFAHKEVCDCAFHQYIKGKCGGESELHYKWKLKIKKEMEILEYVDKVLLEERIGNRIADIVVLFNDKIKEYRNIAKEIKENKKIIIEVQLSKITLKSIIDRTEDYVALGSYNTSNVFWLLGEKFKNSEIIGGNCFITSNLGWYELTSTICGTYDSSEQRDITIYNQQNNNHQDIFTLSNIDVYTGKVAHESLMLNKLIKILKNINKLLRGLKAKKRDSVWFLYAIMKKAENEKRFNKHSQVDKYRTLYVKYRDLYCERYKVTNRQVDNLIKDLYVNSMYIDTRRQYYHTNVGDVIREWNIPDKINGIDTEIVKNSFEKVSNIIEEIVSIESEDICKYTNINQAKN